MTEHPSPERTGAWEIDWDEIVSAADLETGSWEFPDSIRRIAGAVVTSYRRQQAAQGIVEIRKEDLDWAIAVGYMVEDGFGKKDREIHNRLLAAAKEQQEAERVRQAALTRRADARYNDTGLR